MTRNPCALEKKQYILVNARETVDPLVAAARILQFIADSNIEAPNMEGPRESGWREGYAFALAVIREVLRAERGK